MIKHGFRVQGSRLKVQKQNTTNDETQVQGSRYKVQGSTRKYNYNFL
jgi:hypothetical protein